MTNDELQQVIEQSTRKRVTRLNLSRKGLMSLPESIGQLSMLTRLNLNGNQLTSLPESIGQLTNLTQLNLNGNQLKSLPIEIRHLTNLVELNLKDNQLTSFPLEIFLFPSLKKIDLSSNQLENFSTEFIFILLLNDFNQLNVIDLSFNRIKNLPVEIGRLANLKVLNLSGNQLISLPVEIGQLVNLRVLNLSGNQLTSLPSGIERLTGLSDLYLWRNQLTNLPQEIGQLANLRRLIINENQLTDLPVEIGQLSKLRMLDVSDNRLSRLPAEIGQLNRLRTLNCRCNRLRDLPSEIGQLVSLNILNLDFNQLKKLPEEIGRIDHLTQAYLGNNPLSLLPAEIRYKESKSILNFYRQLLEQSIDRLYEAKLLIVGESGAGKTTLAKKIKDSHYQLQQNEPTTEGIEVISWNFPYKYGKEFRVNIWDFGGQEIYHATHQFFLTKRSLYILVADSRKEDTDFYYWLNVVELLSKNSPLLIIKNEKQERKREINERQLRGEFTNLKESLATNLATNRGLSEILRAIQHYMSVLPHVGTELPKNWVRVRDSLEQEIRNYISLEEYLKICQDCGFKRQEDALLLSSYLHDLGVCLHFQEDDLLLRTVILKPTWGTDAVYKVLDNTSVIKNLGKFTREDLKVIWHEEKYATMRPELLRLMMNFKLCYEIPNYPGVYIAPQLLSPDQPEYAWDEVDNLFLCYEYEFMPKGILTRFIVEMHAWIENQMHVWKTGVVLTKDNTRVEVVELYRYHKGEIRIRVAGSRKRDLLTTVRYELDNIHNSYERLKCYTLVPCNCVTCKDSQRPYFYQLQVLHRFLDNGQDQIQCQNGFQMVNVGGLINDVIPDKPQLSSQSRLQAQQAARQKAWELRNEKLRRLREDLAIATETTRKFELEQQIQAEEEALAQLAAELDDIEQQLSE